MQLIDWIIVAIPLFIVLYVGIKTQKYVKGVSDFLTAGRVAGRYVICVAGGEAAMGLVSLAAMFENYYKSGFAYSFWSRLATPIGIVMALTGYCIYRYRETRAMTLGQFLEIRYSRKFRLFAGILQSIAGIINYSLFPAVGARFIVYFCGLPANTEICGYTFPTFALLMAAFLAIAVFVATLGGQITIMVTDCIQGILSYPMYAIIVGFIIYKYSWSNDMAPTVMNRPKGQSMINPFDITELRDFNLFYVIVGIFENILNRMGWAGTQGYNAAAKNAHEQKMGSILGAWRVGFSTMMYILLALVAFMYLHSEKFAGGPTGADACRSELAVKTINDVVRGDDLTGVRSELITYVKTGNMTSSIEDLISRGKSYEARKHAERERIKYGGDENDVLTVRTDATAVNAGDREKIMDTVKNALKGVDPHSAQTFATIFGQMRVPMTLRYLLPVGITGIFCALCIFLLISTDTTYLHSWGSILVQDVILPIRGKPFTPRQQLFLLRILIASVAVFAFFFSFFFGQVDYILMFFAITGAIWMGGSGPCIVGGLYWKRGTTAGAWVALISGSLLAFSAIFLQSYWADVVYPWLYSHEMVDSMAIWLKTLSSPFEPIIKWRMNSTKFPINSKEILAMSMLISVSLYVIVSLLTCKKPFNMDRMLHRGKYAREGDGLKKKNRSLKNILLSFVGIDSQYTRGDKILAWSVFGYSLVWRFLICFVVVAVWNVISPWSNHWWSVWFFIDNFVIACTIAVVSTVWFTWGGTRDLCRLFRDLAVKETNVLDDGRVIDNVSADDVEMVEDVDKVNIEEAHIEERILDEELKEKGDIEDLRNLEKHSKE
ncbi:MAG TPA: sodium:panthothenate symporter [Phycisphaerae bacterium]|nr:sodium:panthothenate symporter [Phycisphaerae bacterium]